MNAIARFLGSCLRYDGGGPWLAFAALGPVLVFIGAATLLGGDVLAAFPDGSTRMLVLLVAFGEEILWRGFALPRLQQRLGAFISTALLGCAYALLHGSFAASLGDAFVLTWMFNRTGGVVAVGLWQGSLRLVTAQPGPLADAVGSAVAAFGLTLAVIELALSARGGSVLLPKRRPAAGSPDPAGTSR